MAEPHQILGIAIDASTEEIRAAYKVLAVIYHPDRHASASSAVQMEAGRRMAELNAAYQGLIEAAEMDVVYGTRGWTNHQRAALTEAFLDAGIPHEWNGMDMTVTRQYELVVDRLISRRR